MVPYLGGIATWFLANGLQFVMVPTLVIITLGGTAGDLAAAQVALACAAGIPYDVRRFAGR